MSNENNQGKIILIIAAAVAVVLVTYFFLKILFVIGLVLLFLSVILLIMGGFSQDNELLYYGFIGLVIGIVFLAIGNEGISFFEENPTGKNLLDAANTIVNSTKDFVKK